MLPARSKATYVVSILITNTSGRGSHRGRRARCGRGHGARLIVQRRRTGRWSGENYLTFIAEKTVARFNVHGQQAGTIAIFSPFHLFCWLLVKTQHKSTFHYTLVCVCVCVSGT